MATPAKQDRPASAVGWLAVRRGLCLLSAAVPLPDRPPPSHAWRWLPPVAALIVLFHLLPVGAVLDRAFLDFASRRPLRDPAPPDGSALVLIDDATMRVLGREPYGHRWPFPRADFAGLIAALDRAGAARIVLDFTFFDQSNEPAQDLLLAGTAAAVPSVVLARTSREGPVFWTRNFVASHPGLFRHSRAGLVDFHPDEDGISRRYDVPDSLAALACDPPATVPGGILHWYGGLDKLAAGGRVPVLSAARFIVRGIDTIDQVAQEAPDLTPAEIGHALAALPPLSGDPAFAAVRGRTVFVGANAAGTFDVKPTPVSRIDPGVLIHWTAWADLKAGSFIRPLPRWVALTGGLLVAVLVGWAARRRHGLAAPGWTAGGLAVGCLLAAYVALSAGWFLAPATPVAAAVFSLLGVTTEGFVVERQRKRAVQEMFGSYVAPEVVDLLVRDPRAIRLGGERRELTVLFSDLAGFTDLSEKIPPEQLLVITNRYLQEVSDGLLEGGAYIDKYIGDAIMAVFGAPQARADHALAACRSALAAQRILSRINVDFERDHGRTLHMRIGVNTGPMIVGNLGSTRKRNYTVLGDAVNLASRLEAANKEFGTTILLGEITARAVQGRLVTRPLARLRVKGKTEAVEVHELVGEPGTLTGAQEAFLAAYGAGYADLCARRFAGAAAGLARARELRPDDIMARTWHQRADEYIQRPPSPDWQPLLKLESK